MECVCWSNGQLLPMEEPVHEQQGVTVYNRNEKSGFQMGKLRLTSFRILWHDLNDPNCILDIKLPQIQSVELKSYSQLNAAATSRTSRVQFSRLSIRLERWPDATNYVAYDMQPNPCVEFEFEYGGHNEFNQQLNQQLERKHWTYSSQQTSSMHNVGITGIQRKIQDRLDLQDQKITDSFKDLSILMNQAKDMVNLSNSIINKMAAKEAAKSTDETDDSEDMKKLKGYFHNMGIIDNPVTREESGSKYYKALALEIYNNLTKVIEQHGGIMTLADVYCRLNRARAIAGLVSVDDLLNACKELNKLNYELKYNIYKDLNLHVLELVGSDFIRRKLTEICDIIRQHESLTAYALSKLIDSSLIVAKKLLLDGEKNGLLCRDDTNMGLRFYPNLFLQK